MDPQHCLQPNNLAQHSFCETSIQGEIRKRTGPNRKPKMSNFLEYKDLQVVYKRYARQGEKLSFYEFIYLCATSEKLIFFTDFPFLLYNKMIFPLVQFVFLLCCGQGRQWTQCIGNNSPVSLSFSFLLRFMYNGFDVTFKSQKLCL
jgi:hypothetical protein